MDEGKKVRFLEIAAPAILNYFGQNYLSPEKQKEISATLYLLADEFNLPLERRRELMEVDSAPGSAFFKGQCENAQEVAEVFFEVAEVIVCALKKELLRVTLKYERDLDSLYNRRLSEKESARKEFYHTVLPDLRRVGRDQLVRFFREAHFSSVASVADQLASLFEGEY